MKTVYFLRHGQTPLNRQWRHQFDDTPLSEKGREQVRHASKKLAGKGIEVIITSSQARAKETAHIVGEMLGLLPEENELFCELRRPSNLHGTHWLSLRSLWSMGLLYLHAGKKEWQKKEENEGDGENLHDFHARVRRGLEYLTTRPEKHILVVTHRGIIATAMLQMQHDGTDTVAEYRKTLRRLHGVSNASRVTTTWTPEGEGAPTLTGTWRICVGS